MIFLICSFLLLNIKVSSSIFPITKCCSNDQQAAFDEKTNSCVPAPILENPGNYSSVASSVFKNNESGRPDCSVQTEIKHIRRFFQEDVYYISEEHYGILQEPENNNESWVITSKDKLCIESAIGKNETLIVEFCSQKCDKVSPCLRKCCPPHQIVDISGGCNHTSGNWKAMADADEGVPNEIEITHFGLPNCKFGSYEEDFKNQQNRGIALTKFGSLLIISASGKELYVSWDNFCIDGLQREDLDEVLNDDHGPLKDRIAFICFPELENDTDESFDVLRGYRRNVYPVFTGISAVFLLITSIIYAILWKDLNLPGWLQFSYSICLLIVFTLLTIVQIWSNEIFNYSKLLCKTIGYTLHATFLSCFFWLTSMNIDLWLSFRNTTVTTSFGRGKKGKRRFLFFALISLSIPLAVSLFAIITDYEIESEPGKRTSSNLLHSGIGESSCALNIGNWMVHLFYFYGVVGSLLIVNLMFFFCTVLCLRERRKETKFAQRQCSGPDSADLIRFRLFTRLFFIMGICWIFELISWLTSFFDLSPKIQLIFVGTDCLNALQGIAIFFMFVWKPQTWRQLRKKVQTLQTVSNLDSNAGAHTTKSSIKSSLKSTGSSSCKAVSP